MSECWNSIGVRGDRSCPELEQYAHCSHCPVYARAATRLLDGAPPDDYTDQWTAHFAQPALLGHRDTESVVLFRLAAEWFALPTAAVEEIAPLKPIHSIPHRRTRTVVGIANIRGELLVCVSLAVLLEVEAAPPDRAGAQDAGRLLVLRSGDVHAVCPVDEVSGVIRFDPRTLSDVPATLAHAANRYTKRLLSWRDRFVGVLDDQLVFYTLGRSLA